MTGSKDRHQAFLKRNVDRLKTKSKLGRSDLNDLFVQLIELHNLPFPPSELYEYFLHPNIIQILLIEVNNSRHLTPNDRQDLSDDFNVLYKLLNTIRGDYRVDFRILAPGGNYPNIELERGGCKYSVNNQFPVLLTKNRNKKDFWSGSSLINWLTRNELKFATSVMCAPDIGLFHFHFTSHNSVNVDFDCINFIPNELRISFLRELLDIQRRFMPIGNYAWDRKPLPDINEYEFSNFSNYKESFKNIFDSFSIQDDLLLRTCNYFVKSRMHWDNLIMSEEAITNNFFCLEGCLHLIQKKYGEYQPKLNLRLLKQVFKNDIPFGENLFNFIQEGYEKRISLVHAEPIWGADWSPFITSEDFYEYFKICRVLLNFILINRNIDDF